LYVNGRLVAEKEAAGTVDLPARAELEVAAYLRREPFMELANLVRDVRLYDDDIGPTQVRQRFQALQAMVEEGIILEDRFHFIAGPYLNRMTQKSVTLVWETDRPATGVVRFGRKLPYDREVRATAAVRLQTIELAGLEPETTYFYEITAVSANGTEIASGPLTFKTAVRETSPLAFAILGDTEARPHINNQIAKAIWAERPDFIAFVGDLTDGGKAHHKFEWNLEYFLGMSQLVSRIPLFPVPGNGESDLHWYLRYHGLAQSEHRYSFRYGNTEFFMLDSNQPMGPGSEQYDWLDKALAASRAQWKFVCHHHPVYSSDDDDFGDTHSEPSAGGDSNPRSAVALYEKHGVDIVFYGHIHAYERTWPMADGAVNVQRGIRYVQTGGGGGNLEDFSPTRNAFTGKLYRGHHYCLINIHGGSLRFQMFDVEGRLRDSFEMTK
jgi:predicted phosphodiesterase